MGRAYITYVYDDAIRGATNSPEEWKKISSELGDAILKLCLTPEQHYDDKEGLVRIKDHKIGAGSNALNFVDDVHSSDDRLYLWSQNCFRPLNRLPDDDLTVAADLLDAAQKARPKT
jgi:hypothetical protein